MIVAHGAYTHGYAVPGTFLIIPFRLYRLWHYHIQKAQPLPIDVQQLGLEIVI